MFGVGFLEPYIKQLLALITLLLQEKTQCQCPEFDEADEDALFNVEQAESLLSTTFDLLGAVAQACGPSFEPHFRPLASLMMPLRNHPLLIYWGLLRGPRGPQT